MPKLVTIFPEETKGYNGNEHIPHNVCERVVLLFFSHGWGS